MSDLNNPGAQIERRTSHLNQDVKLAVMETKLNDQIRIVSKLTESIESINEVAKNMNELIKIHDLKLEQQAERQEEIVSNFKKENDRLTDKILELKEQQSKEILDLKEAYRETTQQIKDMRTDTLAEMGAISVKLSESIDRSISPLSDEMKNIKQKNEFYDRMRWVLLGAASLGVLLAPGGLEFLSALLK